MEHSGSGDNIGRDKHEHYHYPKHNTPNQLTTHLGEFPNFKGRKDETKELKKLLNEKKAVVVHGIGGIGKSSFVSSYLDTYKNEFLHYGFINWTDNIKLNIYNDLQVNMKLDSYNDIDKNFDEVIRKLRNLKGKKLLIIDRIEEKEINYREEEKSIKNILTLIDNDYKVIFSSRFKIKFVTPYLLKVLSLEDAREVFLTYYKTDEINKVDKILEYLDYHSFFVKLVSETLELTNCGIDIIIQKFIEGELSQIEFIDEYTMDTISFNKNLKTLFNMQKINQDALFLLKQFSILPSMGIELSLLKNILPKDELLENRLKVLATQGWLIADKNNYKLHQIIIEYIHIEERPLFEDIEIIIDFFIEVIDDSTENSLKNKEYAVFFTTLCNFFNKNIENKKVYKLFLYAGKFFVDLGALKKAELLLLTILKEVKRFSIDKQDYSLYHNLGILYELMGKYEIANKYTNQALSSIDSNDGENIFEVIGIKSKIAKMYQIQGKYKLSEELYLQIIEFLNKIHLAVLFEILEKVKWSTVPNSSILQDNIYYFNDFFKNSIDEIIEKFDLYHGIGILYQSMSEYELSESCLLKSLKIRRSELNQDSLRISKICNTLGHFYYTIQSFKESEKFHLEAVSIREEVLGKEHPETSTSYNNLGLLYMISDSSKALKYFSKSLKIREEKLGRNHPRTATVQQNLGDLYLMVKHDYVKALSFFKKALKIKIDKLSEIHPEVSFLYRSIAMSYFSNNQYKDAKKNINKSINIQKETLSLEHPEYLVTQEMYQMITNKKSSNLLPISKNHSKKVGRNEKCSCESGKKYKKCCGKNS